MIDSKDIITVREAAARGPISEYNIRQLCAQGKIAHIRLGCRTFVNYPAMLATLEQMSLDSVRGQETA